MSKKNLLIGLAIVIAAGLALPVINLVAGPPSETPLSRDPAIRAALAPVLGLLEAKCSGCHTADPDLPFYASLPLAAGIVQADINKGRRYLDIVEDLLPVRSGPPAEAALAKIERVIAEGTMPPGRYIALNWDAGLDAAERREILGWVKQARSEHHADTEFTSELREAVVRPLPRSMKVAQSKAELGRALYHDTRLSGDDTIACASCHDLGKGGTDQAVVSTGIRGQKSRSTRRVSRAGPSPAPSPSSSAPCSPPTRPSTASTTDRPGRWMTRWGPWLECSLTVS